MRLTQCPVLFNYAEDYTTSESAFPSYFDNKWLVYEWMRDWVYVVHLDENHQFVQADPFMPDTEFSHPMDMLFLKDGKLYTLEYGQQWYKRNLDARLSVFTKIKWVSFSSNSISN